MQAIKTKYLSATNHRNYRIKATCAAKSITIDCDSDLSNEENHIKAAKRLIVELEWENNGKWSTGCLANGDYVHTCYNDVSTNWYPCLVEDAKPKKRKSK
jgi:hypothetical protein